jgi:hypothetical protein
MAMSVGGKGGPSADINVTPLIDVLLVLLIIFMVITPLTPKPYYCCSGFARRRWPASVQDQPGRCNF